MLADLQGKQVAILGFGREGRSIWQLLKRYFPDQVVSVFDENPNLAKPAGNAKWMIGPAASWDLTGFDCLVKSPGISNYAPAIQQARSDGALVTSATNLWLAEHANEKVLAVTGTKGKSTTASLLATALAALGKQVQLVGNVGIPVTDFWQQHSDYWVMELSSYQLADLQGRPEMAIILNLSPEHLDWHRSSEQYFHDKWRLAELVADESLLLNAADARLRILAANRAGTGWFNQTDGWHCTETEIRRGGQTVLRAAEITLRGAHNLENLCAVLAALELLQLDFSPALAALQQFSGLPHRLEHLGRVGQCDFVNDSISTTPVSSLAALRAYAGQPVILLLGGYDRGLDWSEFAQQIAEDPPYAILTMPDNGAQIRRALEQQQTLLKGGITACADLAEAVVTAYRISPPGACIILSPGAPSFPQFDSYVHRGDCFTKLVRGLREE